jgi:hypothetical protein
MPKKTAAQLQKEINAALARTAPTRAHAKQRVIDVYEFDELSAKAKDRAITKYRESGAAFDTDDTEAVSDMFRETLKEKGLPTDDVRWRLSSSQGDGVSFYGRFDVDEYLQANKLKSKFPALKGVANDIVGNIEKIGPHMYDHWNTMRVYFEPQVDLTERQNAELEKLKEFAAAHIQKVSRELEKAGYEEIEYREGDGQIAEILRENDYEFDVDGDRI